MTIPKPAPIPPAPKALVKPALGRDGKPLLVRDPKTLKRIPDEGKEVELDTFIRRRLRDGDLEKAEPEKGKPAKKKQERPAATPKAQQALPSAGESKIND